MAATADCKPTLKELQRYVVKHASEVWEELGIELELDDNGTILDQIRREREGNESKCCLDVVKKWRQGAGVEPKTWGTLLDCLREIPGAERAIDSIQENVFKGCKMGEPATEPEGQSGLASLEHGVAHMPTTAQPSLEKPLPLTTPMEHQQSEEEKTCRLTQVEGQMPSEASEPCLTTSTSDAVEEPEELDMPASEMNTADPTLQTAKHSDHSMPLDSSGTQEQRSTELVQHDLERQLPHKESIDEQQDLSTSTSTQEPIPNDVAQSAIPSETDTTALPENEASATHPSPEKPKVTKDQVSSEELDFSVELKPGQHIREYQRELAEPGINGENYIICAPTGTGKTLVAALVVSDHLQKRKGKGRVVFIVDKKPLARQQTEAFKELIPNARVQCSTGDDLGMTIKTVLPENDIVVCTAGKLLNELKEDRMKFDMISLVVIDECHHTIKDSPHAKVLEKYLEEKETGREGVLSQVIGLTASPGAGDNPTLDMEITIQHLISLCALMDATSGIKTVEVHRQELDAHTNKPSFTLKTMKHRDPNEAFVRLITEEMMALERLVGLNCAFNKWTQKYESAIQQKRKTLEDNPDRSNRDQISVLELLWCYSRTLEFYMDLRYEDAISVLDNFKGLPPMDKATSQEKMLRQNRESLAAKLAELPRVTNPLLDGVQRILEQQFSRKPDSKVIIFVRTKRHASSMCEWASSLPVHLKIKPQVVTGHTSETGMGMTQTEQELALKKFHDSTCNLLISTSVAEEGLDVPACNAVIRFQHVSNEIAKVQTRGRARAEDSVGFTILSSDTQKTIQEIRNGELESLVEKILMSGKNSCFPRGPLLREQILDKQREIMHKRRFQKQFAAIKGDKREKTVPASSVQLKCKKCKTLACKGSDVYTLENATQYVVPDEGFHKGKIQVKPRSSPKKITMTMTVTKLIHCANCDVEWGNMCVWPTSGLELPVLKCKSFTFEVDGKPQAVKKWSESPFEIPPLSSLPEYQESPSSDSEPEATGTD